jgi:hypothetical protein
MEIPFRHVTGLDFESFACRRNPWALIETLKGDKESVGSIVT